ncbi:hypothetical protein ACFLSY_11175 [Bacteroidota bacterium]
MDVLIPEKIIIVCDFVPDKNTKIKGYKKDKLMYAISKIFIPTPKQLQNEQDMKEISSYEWKTDLSDNYRDVLDFGEELGIIVCDHQYEEGEKSMGYMIAPEWISNPTIFEIEDFCLVRKFIKNVKSIKNSSCPHLDKRITDPSLTLSISSDEYLKNYTLIENNLSTNQLTYDLWTLLKYEQNNHTAKRDLTSGRYHSIVSSTSKRIRPYLRFNGEQLVELDITNCQPFCSLLLLDPDFYLKELKKSKINLTKITKLSFFSHSSNINHLLSPSTSIPSIKIREILKQADSKDVEIYKKVVLEGKLYEWVQSIVESKLNLKLSRSEIKEAFFYVLYSGKKAVRSEWVHPDLFEIKRLIYSLLPNVFAIFNQFKKTDYRTLSILLQRIESYLIIDLITKSIPQGIPIYTIHDSILTSPKHAKYVQKKLIEDIEKYTGFSPKIVIKD